MENLPFLSVATVKVPVVVWLRGEEATAVPKKIIDKLAEVSMSILKKGNY